MNARRILVIILAAVAAAGLTFLASRLFGVLPDAGTKPLTDTGVAVDETASVSVPWPTPPSASPLTLVTSTPVVTPADARAAAVFMGVNEQRTGMGLSVLGFNESLAVLARIHADDMAARSYLDHVTPEGVTFKDRLDTSGYSYVTAAENLGFASHLELIVPDWMRSPGHRANILNKQFTEIGIAIAQGTWQGVAVTYVTAVFARPR